MRINTLVTLGASAAFGIMAIVLARGWIEGAVESEFSHKRVATQAAPAPALSTVPVVVADIPLSFGDTLTREALRIVDMPDGAVPEGAYTNLDDIFGNNDQRTVVLTRMAFNEPLLGFKISGPGGRGSLSSLISEGMRATAIRVTDVAGVAGFVLPGDYVDVIYTRDQESRRGNSSVLLSDVILQNIRVLGIDQNLDSQTSDPNVVKTVTVEVSNQDAQRLHLAMDAGRLSLTLRRIGEEDIQKEKPISSKTLVAKAAKAPVNRWRGPKAPAKLTPPTPINEIANITIIRGEDRDEVNVAMEVDPAAAVTLNSELAGG